MLSKDKSLKFIIYFQFFYLFVMLFFIPISQATLEVCFGWSMLLFSIIVFLRKDLSVFKDSAAIFLAIFFLSGILSLFNTPLMTKSIKTIFLKWFEYVMLFFIFKEAIRCGLKPKFMLIVIYLSALLICVDGAVQFITGVDFLRHDSLSVVLHKPIKAISASMGHSNGLAAYLLIPIFLLITHFFNSENKNKILIFSFILLILFIFTFTFSRAAWLGFIISLAFLLIKYHGRFKFYNKSIVILVAITVCLLFYSLFLRDLFSVDNLLSSSRIKLWENSFLYTGNHPIFGNGAGIAMDIAKKLRIGCQYLHNSFLQIFFEQGFIGLFGFLGFMLLVLIDSLKYADFKKDYFLIGLTFGVIAFLIHAFFDNHLYSLRLSFLFWVSMGIIRGLTIKLNNENAWFRSRSMKAFFILFLLFIAAASYYFIKEKDKAVIRVGFSPSITCSQAIVGLANGDFQRELGDNIRIETEIFDTGRGLISAMLKGQIDLAYIEPAYSLSGYVKSNGSLLRVISGATSAGPALVIRKDAGIKKIEDLRGKKIAFSQIGNTQYISLRTWLKNHNFKKSDVVLLPVYGDKQLSLFLKKEIDAVWTIEPWVSFLIRDAGGSIFFDERLMWPSGEFVTTHVIVRKDFLDKNRQIVKKWLLVHIKLTDWINKNKPEAKTIINKKIRHLTGKSMPDDITNEAFSRLTITYDPKKNSLLTFGWWAFELKLFGKNPPDFFNMHDLSILNEALEELGRSKIRQ